MSRLSLSLSLTLPLFHPLGRIHTPDRFGDTPRPTFSLPFLYRWTDERVAGPGPRLGHSFRIAYPTKELPESSFKSPNAPLFLPCPPRFSAEVERECVHALVAADAAGRRSDRRLVTDLWSFFGAIPPSFLRGIGDPLMPRASLSAS